MSEIEETLNRIKTHKAVRGIVVCNAEGKIVRNTFAEGKKEEGENIARTIPPLAIKARNAIRDLDSSNELTFLRLRSRNYEIMVAPDKEFMLIVVQDTKGDKKEVEA